ncbi:MAG: hypothetical protein ABSF61_13680 [Anaerolineales bacterium]
MNGPCRLLLAVSALTAATLGCQLLGGITSGPSLPSGGTSNGGAPSATPIAVNQGGLSLVLTAPTDGAIVSTFSVKVAGRTAPGAAVSFNDSIGMADSRGNFELEVPLDQGLNTLEVVVSDAFGRQLTYYLAVTSQAGP